MHFVTTTVAGALALAALLYLGLARFPPEVERRLLDQAQSRLAAADIRWAAVRISGRDLYLAGIPPDVESHTGAVEVLRGTAGLRVIIDETGNAGQREAAAASAPAEAITAAAAPRISLPAGASRSPEQAARICQSSFDALLTEEQIRFMPGTTEVALESTPLLKRVARAAARCESLQLEVAVHTDSSGDPNENLRNSQARAEAIVAYLVTRGVDGNRLDARGYGAQAPVASNRTAAGRERNRRIELTVLRDTE